MRIALSATNRLYVFEILELTIGPGGGTKEDTATIHNGYGISLTLSDMDKLRDAVDAYLAGIDTETQTNIEALCTAWVDVRLCTGSIEGGNMGEIGGVSINFEEKRMRIKTLMQTYVPVLSLLDSIRRRNDNQSPGFVQVMR